MDETRQIDRALHDEHIHVAGLLRRLSDLLGRGESALVAPDEAALRLFAELQPVLDGALERHFRYEEEILFPRLDADGADDLTGLLREEHDVLLPPGRAPARNSRRGDGRRPRSAAGGFGASPRARVRRPADRPYRARGNGPAAGPGAAIEDDEDRRIAMEYQAG